MDTVSTLRLNLLRCGYLLLAAGICAYMWPTLLTQGPRLDLMQGVELSLLCTLGLLSVLGLRYPLRMLPLLLFEMMWKALWLLRIALPLWLDHRMSPDVAGIVFACSIAIVFPFLVPWGYVARFYLQAPGDRWWGKAKA